MSEPAGRHVAVQFVHYNVTNSNYREEFPAEKSGCLSQTMPTWLLLLPFLKAVEERDRESFYQLRLWVMHVVYGVIKQEDGKKEKGYHTVGEGISDSNPETKDYKLLGQPLRYLLQIFNTTFIPTYLPFEFLHTFIYIYSHAWDCSSPFLNGCCDLFCGWLELIAFFSFFFFFSESSNKWVLSVLPC